MENQRAESRWTPRAWIIPPGLWSTFDRFAMRCDLIIEKFTQGRSRPLIIRGPTGVGKSMFAEFFVYKFQKKTTNLNVIYLNCAAIPDTLLESELFGYEKGSHDKADTRKIGYFEAVGDGVIVLEEIGEMAKPLQAKLLMAIENKKFARIGGTKTLDFRAQIIATSNTPKDDFRPDFWYRFDVFSVPPIYKRREDILYYINMFDPELTKILTKGAVISLLAYNWPGNVREIERVCNYVRENIELNKVERLTYTNVSPDMRNFQIIEDQKRIMDVEDDVSGLALYKLDKFKSELESSLIDVSTIEGVLNFNELSLDIYGPKFIGDDNNLDTYEVSLDGKGLFKKLMVTEFELAYYGYKVFCRIFFQDDGANNDILDMKSFVKYKGQKRNNVFVSKELPFGLEKLDDGFIIDKYDYHSIPKESRRVHAFIFCGFCSGMLDQDSDNFSEWIDLYKTCLVESLKFFTEIKELKTETLDDLTILRDKYKSNKFLSNYFGTEPLIDKTQEIPISKVTKDDLIDLYYETILNEVGMERGFQKKVSDIAGPGKSAISQNPKFKKITDKFRELNNKPRKRLIVVE